MIREMSCGERVCCLPWVDIDLNNPLFSEVEFLAACDYLAVDE
jgi:hypothetical protein